MFLVGDGREGFEEEGPYDAIHVGAAAPTLPEKVENYMVLPMVMPGESSFFTVTFRFI